VTEKGYESWPRSPVAPQLPVAPHRPVELTLDQCIKCNICVTACPVTAVTDLFPGPKYEGPQSGRFRANDQPTPDHSVDYCNGCRVCNMVCPTGVRIAEINGRARADIVKQGKSPWRLRLRNNLVARPESLGKLAQPVAPLANFLLHMRLGRWLADKTLAIHSKAPLPRFSRGRFTSWFNRQGGRARPRGQRHRGDCAPPELLRSAAAFQRRVRRRASVPREQCS
jgi:glycerol-3-phosphate dehydrogenase subunit C